MKNGLVTVKIAGNKKFVYKYGSRKAPREQYVYFINEDERSQMDAYSASMFANPALFADDELE